MISKYNKIIQVKVSKDAYNFLKKYSELYKISISRYCEMAIDYAILKYGESKERYEKLC